MPAIHDGSTGLACARGTRLISAGRRSSAHTRVHGRRGMDDILMLEGGWWTQSQPIRTVAEVPLSFPILQTRRPSPYQYLAEKAIELRRLGMSVSAVAKALRVTD